MIRVSDPPSDKPVMVYDGECFFCCRWIERWKRITGQKINYVQSQSLGGAYKEIPAEAYRRAVFLVDTDGNACSAAEAVFKSLAYQGPLFFRLMHSVYSKLPPFRWISEFFYRLVASNRMFFSGVEKTVSGQGAGNVSYSTSAAYFRVFLGLIFLSAFVSAWIQIIPLVGESGIYPVHRVTDTFRNELGVSGAFFRFPTLSVFSSGDGMLILQCAVGVIFSIVAALGILQGISFLILGVLYLSISVAGTVFFSFQWDTLLVETALLALFVSPNRFRIGLHKDYSPAASGVWLIRWLLFRLMFASGYLKWLSGDEEWRRLTAISFHYWTQPLPTFVSAFMSKLPQFFHQVSTVLVLVMEIIIPFGLFMGHRIRRFSLSILFFLMALIMMTGNYCFFNLLAIALMVLLWGTKIKQDSACSIAGPSKSGWMRYPRLLLCCVILFYTSCFFFSQIRIGGDFVSELAKKHSYIRQFRTFNTYGLFIGMTNFRDEIIIEGSRDKFEWREYTFKYKPGDVSRVPLWNIPHQPRLDWQMWFASLGTIRDNPWLVRFMTMLLDNNPLATGLIEHNPFADSPPNFIRAVRYQYTFASMDDIRKGVWWERGRGTGYSPILSRRSRPVDDSSSNQ